MNPRKPRPNFTTCATRRLAGAPKASRCGQSGYDFVDLPIDSTSAARRLTWGCSAPSCASSLRASASNSNAACWSIQIDTSRTHIKIHRCAVIKKYEIHFTLFQGELITICVNFSSSATFKVFYAALMLAQLKLFDVVPVKSNRY